MNLSVNVRRVSARWIIGCVTLVHTNATTRSTTISENSIKYRKDGIIFMCIYHFSERIEGGVYYRPKEELGAQTVAPKFFNRHQISEIHVFQLISTQKYSLNSRFDGGTTLFESPFLNHESQHKSFCDLKLVRARAARVTVTRRSQRDSSKPDRDTQHQPNTTFTTQQQHNA